ncbi:MAG: FAD-dependent oxidoreductase [Candidatus Woesearchaeota archaeon]|nr:MAG: FAD-dependent oxidoreductase [Candidatus Woesearchaeota archaeon]
MKKVKYLILGGGISGVSFGHFVNSQDFLLLEKNNVLGGHCRSFKLKGFVWDCSGHFLHFRNKEMEQYILELTRGKFFSTQRKSKILYYNKMIDFPFQNNIHQLPLSETVDCLLSYVRKKRRKIKSFKDMILNKYGSGICNKFLIPYNEKLYACDLNSLDVSAMGRFFPNTSFLYLLGNFFSFRKKKFYNDTLFSFKNGIQDLISVLSKNILSEQVSLKETVVKIDPSNKTATTNIREIKYEFLVNTLDLKQFLDLMPANYSKNKLNLACNKVLVFNLGFDKPSNHTLHWIYVPSKKNIFYRVGFYNNIRNERRMSLYVEIGLKEYANINTDEFLSETIKQLKQLNIITDHKLIAKNHVVLNPAYVHLKKENYYKLKMLKNQLKEKNIFLLGRYAEWKYCSIEDNILSAKKLSEEI